jgi:hypothetical protein
MPSKADCVNAVMRAGVDSPARAAEIVDFVLREKEKLAAEGRAANAEGELAGLLLREAEHERAACAARKRAAALTVLRRAALEDSIANLRAGEPGMSFERAVIARLWGDRSRAAGARDSAARRMSAHRARLSGDLAREIAAHPEIGEALRRDPGFDAAVRREMISPGSSGDAAARAAAAIFSKSLEDARTALNDAGANIGKLEGYAPQNHNAAKLLRAGSGAWVERLLRDLDWERTLPGVPPEDRARVLSELWTTIVTGERGARPGAEEAQGAGLFRRKGSGPAAAGFEHERTLHFRDAEAAAAYHADFGQGTVATVEARLHGLEKSSERRGERLGKLEAAEERRKGGIAVMAMVWAAAAAIGGIVARYLPLLWQ